MTLANIFLLYPFTQRVRVPGDIDFARTSTRANDDEVKAGHSSAGVGREEGTTDGEVEMRQTLITTSRPTVTLLACSRQHSPHNLTRLELSC